MNKQNKLNSLVDTWRFIVDDERKSWVVFELGTCVIVKDLEEDLDIKAKELLKAWGPVVPGTSAGDFNVLELEGHPGWVEQLLLLMDK
ncbi:MAG: hypothetical protein HZR80_20010 [Candidatus Heimdallarchaeota archaeon]